MGIDIFFENIPEFNIDKDAIRETFEYLVVKEAYTPGDISVILCSDEYLLEMNKEYLDHDYYTDIITFDYVEGEVISGDLFISVDRIKDNAQEQGVEEIAELYRVILHGVLHLVGYKDKSREEQKEMRAKEDLYLAKMIK